MTRVYLAWAGSGEARKTFREMAGDPEGVNVLVAFPYLCRYEEVARKGEVPRHPHSILDSGAYSAWKSGKAIDIDALIVETKNPRWEESVCLDVIGDAEASVRNALYMKARGSPAYPVFHIGDPWEHLREYKRQFPKVGLSCRFGEPEKQSLAWLDKCFALAWPHRFHSFGWIKEEVLLRYPFHSADTASWNNPAIFGLWNAFGRKKASGCTGRGRVSVRGMKSLRAEVDWYRGLQRRLEGRWSKVLAKLA